VTLTRFWAKLSSPQSIHPYQKQHEWTLKEEKFWLSLNGSITVSPAFLISTGTKPETFIIIKFENQLLATLVFVFHEFSVY